MVLAVAGCNIHIFLLKKAKDDELIATEFLYTPNEEGQYEVERILKEKNG